MKFLTFEIFDMNQNLILSKVVGIWIKCRYLEAEQKIKLSHNHYGLSFIYWNHTRRYIVAS